MLDSALELSGESWPYAPKVWTREKTGEHGVVITADLPSDKDLARLISRVWKREQRLWWSAWTEGLPVLEPRSWWRSGQQFHVWCVSSSDSSLKSVDEDDASESEECGRIVHRLHARKLAHGALNEFAFFRGSEGIELAPPLNRTLLRDSLRERMMADDRFFIRENLEEPKPMKESEVGSELSATLDAERLSFYELLYYCQVEKDRVTGFPEESLILRLLRKESHPEMGPLKRMSASSFYLSMLREMEGEQLSLVLNDSTDPFETKGIVVSVLGDLQTDEDCLVILPDSTRKFKFQEGWCHPFDIGTAKLMERKKTTLASALRRRHILGWVDGKKHSKERASDRSSLPAAILKNEGIYCVQGPPGTGKTHLACEVVGALLKEDEDARVLVCAKEHQALSILRKKILAQFKDNIEIHVLVSRPRGEAGSDEDGTSLMYAREVARRGPTETSPSSWRKALGEWKGQAPPVLERLYVNSAQVVFATTTSWPMDPRRFDPLFEPFDLVVVEEAGKCYPSELFAPLALSRRALLIGDQNQLPPFQLEETKDAVDHLREMHIDREDDVENRMEELTGKLETRGIKWEEVKSWLQPFARLYRECPSFMLQDQYRMVPLLSDLIGGTFYPKRFVNRRSKKYSLPLFRHPLLKNSRLVWVDVPHCTDYSKAREDLTGHRFNKMEMAIIAKLLRELVFLGAGTPDVAILSPYNAQVDRLAGKKGLRGVLPNNCDSIPWFNPRAHVHTVDSFQGNEADLVVVSMVRNNPFGNPHNAWGFVLNPERLNVMFSRARRQLVVVGCSRMIDLYATYDEVKTLASVLRYFRENGRIVDGLELGVVVP